MSCVADSPSLPAEQPLLSSAQLVSASSLPDRIEQRPKEQIPHICASNEYVVGRIRLTRRCAYVVLPAVLACAVLLIGFFRTPVNISIGGENPWRARLPLSWGNSICVFVMVLVLVRELSVWVLLDTEVVLLDTEGKKLSVVLLDAEVDVGAGSAGDGADIAEKAPPGDGDHFGDKNRAPPSDGFSVCEGTDKNEEDGVDAKKVLVASENNKISPASGFVEGKKKRLHWLDNLKVFLALLVIQVQSVSLFAGEKIFGIAIGASLPAGFSPVATCFLIVSQAFFCPMLFFLAGYFTADTWEEIRAAEVNHRPGEACASTIIRQFLSKNYRRLALPFLIFTWALGPALDWFTRRIIIGHDRILLGSPAEYWYCPHSGPLW